MLDHYLIKYLTRNGEYNRTVRSLNNAPVGRVCGRCGRGPTDGHANGCGRKALFDFVEEQQENQECQSN